MAKFAAKDAKNRFGDLLDTAQREPVTIEKHGRRVAVLLSAREFDELEAMKRERLKAELRAGLDDLDAGRAVDGESFFADMIGEDAG